MGSGSKPERRGGMLRIVRNAGAFYSLSYIVAVAFAAGLTYLEGKTIETTVLPLAFYTVGLAGAVMILLAFFNGARDREGSRPTFGVISYLWLFLAIVIIVASVIYVRLQFLFPEFLPFLPDWLALGFRNAAFLLLFEVGWGMFFGTRRGWLGMESSAWPLGWLIRSKPPGMAADGSQNAQPEEGGNG